MKVASVIFDLDGTLLDTLQDLTDSVNTVLARHNMPLRDIEEIRRFVGNGIPMLIRRAVRAGTSDEEIALCTQEMLDYYAEHCDIKTAPYPGVNELLSLLREKGIDAESDFTCDDFVRSVLALAGKKSGKEGERHDE